MPDTFHLKSQGMNGAEGIKSLRREPVALAAGEPNL